MNERQSWFIADAYVCVILRFGAPLFCTTYSVCLRSFTMLLKLLLLSNVLLSDKINPTTVFFQKIFYMYSSEVRESYAYHSLCVMWRS